jgi:dCTP diphosphatase
MTTSHHDLDHLSAELAKFVDDRQWNVFHRPKNLVMALFAEIGELAEHFMWLDGDQAPLDGDAVVKEIGDVMIYLLHLCRELGVDPVEAAVNKLDEARTRYPVA